MGRLPFIRWCRMHADGCIGAVLVIGGTAAWLPYAFSTTFLYDDYAFVSHAVFHIDAQDSYRPGYRLVIACLTRLFGAHATREYATVALLAAAASAAMYAALRSLHVPRVSSVCAAALTLLYPRADSLRLWWSGAPIDMAIIVACLAVTLVSVWVDRRPRGWFALMAGLAALAWAILTYEAAAVVVLLPLALLPFAVNRSRTLMAAGLEGVVASGAAFYMYRNTDPFQVANGRGPAQWPRHLFALFRDGWQTLFAGQAHRVPVAALLAGVAITLGVAGLALRPVHASKSRSQPARSLQPSWPTPALASCLLLCAGFLAWAPFAPANDYYTPSVPSVGNRVNAFAQLFFLSAAGVAFGWAVLYGRRARVPRRLIAAAVSGGAVTLAVAFAVESAGDARDFVTAARMRQSILASVKAGIPGPIPGVTLILAGPNRTYSAEIIPLFASNWDFNGAVKLLYDDGSVQGFPLDPAAHCAATGMLNGPTDTLLVPYGALWLVDASTRRVFRVADAADCTRTIPQVHAPL